jgi:ufm1-conjugating enzyme 1
MVDNVTKTLVHKLDLLRTRAGPTDAHQLWMDRLKEEFSALIHYVQLNKSEGNDWFMLENDDENGVVWTGKCWYFYEMEKYEFNLRFEIPVGYPSNCIEIELPELDGKTPKMYRGGKICQTVHFKPLWIKNVPRFGIVHALALGLAPWLAAEIPVLVEAGIVSKQGNRTVISADQSLAISPQ